MKKKNKNLKIRPLFVATVALSFLGFLQPSQAGSPEAIEAGKKEFQYNCAVCHGMDGKGTGPLATLLTKGVPDLTLIAKWNSGTFPTTEVMEIIDGRVAVAGHGSQEMPVWGIAFREDESSKLAKDRILNLTLYLESILAN